MPRKENSPYRLFVEGKDDLHTIVHLLKKHDYDWDNSQDTQPLIVDCGGIDPLLKDLPVAVKGHYSRVGVVLDADNSSASRWDQLKKSLSKIDIVVPDSPNKGGTIFTGVRETQSIGAWLMPDNSADGELEDFIKTLVPKDDVLWPEAQSAVIKVRGIDDRANGQKLSKAQIHTWLAWQKEPDIQFGVAISQKVLTSDGPLAESFVKWFKSCFRPNPHEH